MKRDRPFGLASAVEAASHGKLPEWVGAFLASRGSDNAVLAAALAQRRHHWTGPMLVPLASLERLAGPEDEVLVPIEPEEWEEDVAAMREAIDEGWEPPPLLAQCVDGRLLLQDGNHRYQALLDEGATEAWVVIWSDD